MGAGFILAFEASQLAPHATFEMLNSPLPVNVPKYYAFKWGQRTVNGV